MASRIAEPSDPGVLRARLAQLRRELTETTAAYRNAAANHDSNAILLLRSRSLLMRQLLDTQCELLLHLRSTDSAEPAEP